VSGAVAVKPSPKTQSDLSALNVAAIVSGNAFESYDFLAYAFFAPQIGHTLFPGEGTTNLIFSLAGFGVGFLTRPLGGLVLGSYADRVGRKQAMIVSFALMGVSILGLAFVPPFSLIGYLAPALAVALRLLGGFALGGEMGPNTAYLLEMAPPKHRGLYVSFQYATQELAILVAGVVGLTLATHLQAAQLENWGWRVAFLLGALILPIGIVLRKRLPEAAVAQTSGRDIQPGHSIVRTALAALVIFGGTTICAYTIDYLATYAQTTLKLGVVEAFRATAILGLVGACADIAGGWLSDIFGRRRTIWPPLVGLLVLTAPAFAVLSITHSAVVLYAVAAVLAVLVGLWITPALLLVSEALPASRRASGLSLLYAIAISVFGGSTQPMVAGIQAMTHNVLAPAWYMTAAIAVALVATFFLQDIRTIAASPADASPEISETAYENGRGS
jgi:MHS family citrate/tricarballylate:H+ symporter-like MFS transporter